MDREGRGSSSIATLVRICGWEMTLGLHAEWSRGE